MRGVQLPGRGDVINPESVASVVVDPYGAPAAPLYAVAVRYFSGEDLVVEGELTLDAARDLRDRIARVVFDPIDVVPGTASR